VYASSKRARRQLDADPSVDFLDFVPPAAADASTTSDGSTGSSSVRSPFGPLGGAPTLQLVKLRNPNGHAGWRGPWACACGAGGTFHSDDRRWTRARRAALKLGADDGGVFWMGSSNAPPFFFFFLKSQTNRTSTKRLQRRAATS
jgi:hypothetical protein